MRSIQGWWLILDTVAFKTRPERLKRFWIICPSFSQQLMPSKFKWDIKILLIFLLNWHTNLFLTYCCLFVLYFQIIYNSSNAGFNFLIAVIGYFRIVNIQYFSKWMTGETLLKMKAQYCLPPCTNHFSIKVTENIVNPYFHTYYLKDRLHWRLKQNVLA